MASILVLCTANVCRSVMTQAMLSARLTAQGTAADVTSAGLLSDGQRPPDAVAGVLAARGLDVSAHRSRRVTAADLAAADLVIGLAREHVREATVLLPPVLAARVHAARAGPPWPRGRPARPRRAAGQLAGRRGRRP